MRILVTGAAGFIGSHLAEKLAAMGHDVMGLDCFTDYYPPALKKLNASEVAASGVPMLNLDLAEADLSTAVGDVQIIYHAAAQPGIAATVPLETYVRNNIIATHRLLEAALKDQRLHLIRLRGARNGHRGHSPETHLILRRHQARRRATRPRLLARKSPPRLLAPPLLRLRPKGAAGKALSQAHPQHPRRHRFPAIRRQRKPLSQLHVC